MLLAALSLVVELSYHTQILCLFGLVLDQLLRQIAVQLIPQSIFGFAGQRKHFAHLSLVGSQVVLP